VVCAAMSLIGILLGCIVGLKLSRPLGRVAKMMRSVGSLELHDHEEELPETLVFKRYSRVAEVQRLQTALERLRSNIATFECFLPETVVHGILSGDVKAKRLHVEKREVSIMFSDIKDFTNISESLNPKDTLLLLTRYLDVMSRIAHAFDGVVAEILGDGLLVYWNTPDFVPDHSNKAVTTALAQQRALKPLNTELQAMKLPQISIRVGLHTGTVLTGNIGSLTKMKFGCMGDAVNLAARLEGLCKFYEVSTVCSGEMYANLDQDSIFTRKLDVVRVKGKTRPTELYEVIGIEQRPKLPGIAEMDMGPTAAEGIDMAVTKALAASSRVMLSVQGAAWMNTATRAASTVMKGRGSGLCDVSETAAFTLGSEASSEAAPPMLRDRGRRVSYTEIMREPLALCLAESVTAEARSRAGLYEKALRHFQAAEFVDARKILQSMSYEESGFADGAADLLLTRTKKYIAEDGVSIINLSDEQLVKWDGIHNLDEK